MTNGHYDPPSGATSAGQLTPAVVSLDALTVQLSLLDWLPGPFLQRYRVLPHQVAQGKMHVIVEQSPEADFVDELRFVTGLEIVLERPESGGLAKLIDGAIDAWKKGEQTLVSSGQGGVVADDDLVYLEDLGSLGAGSGSGSSSGSGFASEGARMSLSSGLTSGAQPATGGITAVVNPANQGLTSGPQPNAGGLTGRVTPATHGVTSDLPQIVDLEPRIKSGPIKMPVTPPPEPDDPPSAHATTIEATDLGEDGLLDDMGLLEDIDLMEDLEEPKPMLEQPTLPVSDTPLPDHRPARGLTAIIADGKDDDRQRLTRISYSLGFDLEQTSRTLDVIQLLEESTPDLVILDTDLTGTHPFPLAKQLRDETKFAHTALVVTSRMPRDWRLVQDLADTYGINGYLEKPFDTATLLWVVESALNAVREAPLQLRDPDALQAASSLLARGSTLYRRGAVDEAVDLFRKGIELEPHVPGLHVSLAIALVKQRRPFDAMTAFEHAIALDAGLTTAMSNLAMLYEKKGFRHKAFELWARTLHATKDEEKRIELRARIAKLLRGP